MAPQNSGIFFIEGDDESQSFINSHGNSPNPVPGCGPTGGNNNGLSVVSGAMQNHVMMSGSTFPLLFSSNNITIPGPSVADGSNAVQRQDPTCVQLDDSNITSVQTQIPLCRTRRASESLFRDPNNLTQPQKKSRLSNQDDDLTEQISRLQRRDRLLHQQQQKQKFPNLQIQKIVPEQKIRNMHQHLQSLTPSERAQLQRQGLQQQQLQKFRWPRIHEGSVYAGRLVEYLICQRRRPSNSIDYWRTFVKEFFSPDAKKRWCLSHNTPDLSHQTSTVKWECNLCDSKSGRGFEVTFDGLPRLLEIKFASGVLDEHFTLNKRSEHRYDSGITVLEYEKVVKKTVYEHVCVVREGHLRIIFSPQLKILSWEFCTHRHQKLIRQVKCTSTINESGSDGISQQDLQANSNMIMAAGRLLHDLGFSKRYVRGLRISEVASSMKDIMDLCHDQKVGPIEVLKSYAYRKKAGKSKMQEVGQVVNASQGLPSDRNNSLNKHMALRNCGTNIAMNNMNGQGSLPASAQAATFAQATASVLANYQTMLMKQNHPKSDPNNTAIQQEPSTRNQSASQGYQGTGPLLPGFVQTPSIRGVSSHLSPQQQMPSSIYNGSTPQYHQQPPSVSSGNQTLEQKPLCDPAAEIPSTSDKGTNGLDQSQNLEDMGFDASLDFEIDISEFLSNN